MIMEMVHWRYQKGKTATMIKVLQFGFLVVSYRIQRKI